MVLNAAVQMLREADELKQNILKFKSGTSMLQERSVWIKQQQLQKVYQKVLVLDLDYALDKKVEQDLWNVGFKQQIEALQAISKDRKNPLRSEGQAMLSWVLQAAAGFYLCLLHQICTTFKLDLPFRRRASLLGWVEGWGAGEAPTGAKLPPPASARYICQHCLVHLGDLARYRQQLRIAHTFYRHALVVSAHSGQPYNQLALVAWRRGRRLAAVYWHVRSLLVQAPFPPAPANLARTLAAAAAAATAANTGNNSRDKDLPVLPGVTTTELTPVKTSTPGRLNSHSYVNELIRAMHMIHTVDDLDTASSLVNTLNTSLTALVATDTFESMTLIKMACVIMWVVHTSTEEFALAAEALSGEEARARALALSLAGGALLALLLPHYGTARPLQRALPPLKVWLSWACAHPQALRGGAGEAAEEGEGASVGAGAARPQLWPALALTLNRLAEHLSNFDGERYCTVPLPEDEELHGFKPLEASFRGLQFAGHAAWDTYGGQVPAAYEHADQTDAGDAQPPSEVSSICLSNEPELEQKVREYRILQLGKQLAEIHSEHLSFTEEDGKLNMTATAIGGEQLSRALAELSAAAEEARGAGAGRGAGAEPGPDDDSDDERPPPPPPIVISEADFREKVREKRVGILKPQGSLERAREERALANTQDEQETEGGEDGSKEDKKEARKPRVNIAMAAIMRKQEESNKQVKFVTPPPTPDSTTDNNEMSSLKDQDKPKIIQPKAIKSLASLPLGRKTGGILSLKDKSAGYPHLVNTDPEPAKKNEKEEKKEVKPNQSSSQSSQQTYQQKRQDHVPSPNWGANVAPQNYDAPRMSFQKNYGIQNTGISYNPSYQVLPNVNNQGIRLPVVNPKEIDVRTAALQKQNSRQDVFPDGHKFTNHSYQMSGDKKNFLNDLPPRFANQYRYWQNAQENQYENKFRDDNFKTNNSFNQQQQRPNWTAPQVDNYQQPQQMPWWKPDNPPPNFNTNFSAQPLNLSNFYSPHLASNMSNTFQNVPSYNQMQSQGITQQNKSESLINTPNYLQSTIGQPQFQTLQNLVTSPNFSSSLNSFGSYAPTVSYDSSMYPQFNSNKLSYQPTQTKMPDKAQVGYQGSKDLMNLGGGLGFGSNVLDLQQRNLSMSYNDRLNSDMGTLKNLDQIGVVEVAGEAGGGVGVGAAGSTYSLFSGAADAGAWGAPQRHTQQSLWSGPGPSPLERLLEQQKQMKQPSAPQ